MSKSVVSDGIAGFFSPPPIDLDGVYMSPGYIATLWVLMRPSLLIIPLKDFEIILN